MHASRLASVWTAAALAGLCVLPVGCAHDKEFAAVPPPDGSVPRELAKVTLPPYVIADGAGYGEQVYPFPITGSETVLDAIGKINGLPAVASKRHIWVARRSPSPDCADQILPVDWCAITQHGVTATNYQVLPGDR